MATTSDHFCDICASRDLSNIATQWCPECEQGLCTDCIQHHRGFKLSRNHVTIDISNYKKLPDFVSRIKLSCEEHNEKFQLFCPSHDVPCCGRCLSTSHTDCKGLLAMVDIVQNAKASSALEDVEDILNTIRKNIEIIVKSKAQNLKDVQSQFQNVKDVVNDTKQRIIKNVERLESELLNEIKINEAKITDETEHILKEMENKVTNVKEYQENMKAIKEYGTEVQTFFGTREITKFAQAEEQRINAYFEDGTLSTKKIKFKLHEELDKFLTAKSLGSFLLETIQSTVKPVQAKGRAAQIGKSVSRIRSIDDIRVKIKTKFRVSSGKKMSISGCDVTPDGQLVFADYYRNSRVVVHKLDGTYISEVCYSPKPSFDVSVIDEQRVAVSSPGHYTIQIVDISTNKIIKTLTTINRCHGIAYLDEKVISAIHTTGICSYDTGDNMSTVIRKDAIALCSYVTCFQGRIYYTNISDNSVTCLNKTGDVLWKFIDKSMLQNPRGIATDHNGNVFVSSLSNNIIVAISADGKHGRVILTEKEGVNKAWAMCYDKFRDTLVVANYSGDVFVFDIQ